MLKNGQVFSKGRPAYASYDISQVFRAKSQVINGDGVTDDTAALQAIFDQVSTATDIPFKLDLWVW